METAEDAEGELENPSAESTHLVSDEAEIGSATQALLYEDKCDRTLTQVGLQPQYAKIPYCANRDIYTANSDVTRAIVFVHGSDRDAKEIYQTIEGRAQGVQVDLNTTDIIAPQFLVKDDIPAMLLGGEWARWIDDSNSANSWFYGGPDIRHGVWSAITLDHILLQLTLTRPNLKHVVIGGFSAGARLISRYATATQHFLPSGATVSYWSASAGNYMLTGSTRAYTDPGCTGNAPYEYPWGVNNRNQYMNNVSTTAIRQNESNRRIFWTVGDLDLATDKPGCFQTQGADRVERWEYHAIATLFECLTFQTQDYCLNKAQVLDRSVLIPETNSHSLYDSIASATGSNILFTKFRFSSNGKIPGMFCEQLLEPNDTQGTWNDNWLCSNIWTGLRWSANGPIANMQCWQITESAEPASTSWNNNYICLPHSGTDHHNMPLRWSSAGKIPGLQCEQFKETADPHTWNDNYLCW